jgi:hypothetical protein
MTSRHLFRSGVLTAALLAVGCSDRSDAWSKPVNKPVEKHGLNNSIALIDSAGERAVMLTAWADDTIKTTSVPVGRRIVATAPSNDGSRLFVLSQGDQGQVGAGAQPPALTVIESTSLSAPKRFDYLPAVPVGLVVDPTGEYVIVLGGEDFITNPNELIFVDPNKDPSPDVNPRVQNVPSLSGGYPQRFTFTPKLQLAAGDRRLLIIETERDVVLVDPAGVRPTVTLPLSDIRTTTAVVAPAGIAVDPGDATHNPCLAVRAASGDSVFLFTFAPRATADTNTNDFEINVNTVYVGGTPSDIAFVNTNRGMRLAALVPSPARSAVLVDVGNNHVQTAALSDGYRNMDLVTNLISGAGFEQALLWNGTSAAGGVAIWDLGKVPDDTATEINTTESVVSYNLSDSVTGVVDVPTKPLKILQTSSGSLYVFDLDRHTSSPLRASSALTLDVSSDGARVWAFQSGTTKLARIDPGGPSVVTMPIDRPVDAVFEIERSDSVANANDPNKSAVLLHGLSGGGLVGATVFDARTIAHSGRRYSGLLLEGLTP